MGSRCHPATYTSRRKSAASRPRSPACCVGLPFAVAQRPDAVARELAQGAAELREAGFAVEYLEIRDAEALTPITRTVSAPARVFAAVHLGRTRLIDNMAIGAIGPAG